jgi:hypothetical protein
MSCNQAYVLQLEQWNAKKYVSVFLEGRAIDRVKWTKQMCRIHSSRGWFSNFLPYMAAMFIPQLQTFSYSWGLVPSAVGIRSHSYINLWFRSSKTHCRLSFKRCWIWRFWTHFTSIFIGTAKMSYYTRRAGRTESRDFRKTATAIYGREQVLWRTVTLCGKQWRISLRFNSRITFYILFMYSDYLFLQLSCLFCVLWWPHSFGDLLGDPPVLTTNLQSKRK